MQDKSSTIKLHDLCNQNKLLLELIRTLQKQLLAKNKQTTIVNRQLKQLTIDNIYMYGALRELRNITINKGKNKEKEKEKDKDKEKDGVNLDVIVKDQICQKKRLVEEVARINQEMKVLGERGSMLEGLVKAKDQEINKLKQLKLEKEIELNQFSRHTQTEIQLKYQQEYIKDKQNAIYSNQQTQNPHSLQPQPHTSQPQFHTLQPQPHTSQPSNEIHQLKSKISDLQLILDLKQKSIKQLSEYMNNLMARSFPTFQPLLQSSPFSPCPSQQLNPQISPPQTTQLFQAVSKISQLQAILQSKQLTLTELSKYMQQQMNKMNDLQDQLQSVKNIHPQQQPHEEDNTEAIKALAEGLKDKQPKIVQLQGELSTARGNIDQLKATIVQNDQENLQKANIIKDLLAKLHSIKTQKNIISPFQQHISSTEELQPSHTAQHHPQSTTNTVISNMYNTPNTHNIPIPNEFDCNKQTHARLLTQLQQQNTDLKDILSNIMIRNNNMQSQYDRETQIAQRVNLQRIRFTQQNDRLAQINCNLQLQLNIIRNTCAEYQKVIIEKQDQLAKIVQQIATIQEKEKQKENKYQLENKIEMEKYEQIIIQHEQMIKQKQHIIKLLQDQCIGIQIQKSNRDFDIQTSIDFNKIASEIGFKDNSIDDAVRISLQNQLKICQKQNQELKQILNKAEPKLQQITDFMTDFQAINDHIQHDQFISNQIILKTQITQLQTLNTQLSNKCKQHQKQFIQLTNICSTLKIQLEQANRRYNQQLQTISNKQPRRSQPTNQKTFPEQLFNCQSRLVNLVNENNEANGKISQKQHIDSVKAQNQVKQHTLQLRNQVITSLQQTIIKISSDYNAEIIQLRKHIARVNSQMLTLKRKLFTADPNIDMISLVRESYVEQCMVSYARSHQSSFQTEKQLSNNPQVSIKQNSGKKGKLNLGEQFMGRKCYPECCNRTALWKISQHSKPEAAEYSLNKMH